MIVHLVRDVNPRISSRNPSGQYLKNSGSLILEFRTQIQDPYRLGSKPSFTSSMTLSKLLNFYKMGTVLVLGFCGCCKD